MKQKYILFLSLCFVFFSCRKNDVGSVYSFDTVCEIVDYNLICSDENAPWGAIMNMEIVDSILILQHAMDEYAFSFINVNNGELLSQWGRTDTGSGNRSRILQPLHRIFLYKRQVYKGM